MTKRFANALAIQEGACNPSGIALALHEACKECLAEGVQQRTDPAVRLITHQLAHLMNIAEIDRGDLDVYRKLIEEVTAKRDAQA